MMYLGALSILIAAALGLAAAVRPAFSLSGITSVAATISALAGAGAIVWGGAKLLARWLIPTTATVDEASGRAAQYERRTTQEMLDERYRSLLKVARRPVAFLIDDLEKSEAAYVVDLLESILALIREAPYDNGSSTVLVLVVGDRKWIEESLEARYREPRYGAGPGRSTAEVLLGEIFDLDIAVPSTTVELQRDYLADTLDSSGLPASRKDFEAHIRTVTSEEEIVRSLRADSQARLGTAVSGEEVIPTLLEASPSPKTDLALSEAVAKLTSPEEQALTAHQLARFIQLLNLSPREAKRFINQYQIIRTVQILEGRDTSAEASARWIILGQRWPGMRDFLSSSPEMVQYVGSEMLPTEIPENLRPLFQSEPVVRVVKSPPEPLTPALIRLLSESSS